jgi:hypothetical protein
MTSFKPFYVHLLVYLTCLVSCSLIQSEVGVFMRDELEGLWKEVLLPCYKQTHHFAADRNIDFMNSTTKTHDFIININFFATPVCDVSLCMCAL